MLRNINKGISEKQKIEIPNHEQDITFANVDLEIESSDSLQTLIDELGEKVFVLYYGRNERGNDFAALETNFIDYEEVEELVSVFCSLIENLSPKSRFIWDKCHTRKFDVGFESGNTQKSFHTEISAETVRRAAELGTSIVITIYPILNYTVHTP